MIDRLVIASKNPDKVAEIESVLLGAQAVPEIIKGLSWPDVEETEASIEGNALLKARAVFAATGVAALADDTGLFVDVLGGLPGVNTARYAGPDASYADNVEKLLRELEHRTRRTATFRTAVALVGPGEELVVVGELPGRIAMEPRGSNGFGYDPIFEINHRTLAELTDHEKNAFSHRARALRRLIERLSP